MMLEDAKSGPRCLAAVGPINRLGFGELIEQYLTDSRAQNARLAFADLLRQSVYSRLAGYEDVNDAERLCDDPIHQPTD